MIALLRTHSMLVAATAVASCGQQEPATPAAPETPATAQGAVDAAPEPELAIEEKGRRAFAACAVCHSTKDPGSAGYAPMVGPSLFGVYGSPSGHVASFNYSQAMLSANLIWDDATLDAYLTRPLQVVPGTRMAYAGEPNAEKRTALIAYLKTLK